MGFDVNFNNKPVIQSAQSSQDGGAGNLGYFERGEKDGKAKDKSIFGEEDTDSFKKISEINEETEDFSLSKLIAQIILAIKDWFKKIFNMG